MSAGNRESLVKTSQKTILSYMKFSIATVCYLASSPGHTPLKNSGLISTLWGEAGEERGGGRGAGYEAICYYAGMSTQCLSLTVCKRRIDSPKDS